MALVDVLDLLTPEHAGRRQVIGILAELVAALERFQDPETGLWYQVVDRAGRKGNYLEASASAMFAYAVARGANLGVIDGHFRLVAEKAFDGMLSELVTVDPDGEVHLNGICIGAGLGGHPYRDGSYDYYVTQRAGSDDAKGVGPFILTSLELGR